MDRTALAWRVGLAHLALALLLQIENAAHLAAVSHRGGEAGGTAWLLFAAIPFLQLANLAVSLVLALVAWGCAGRRWLRPLPHLLLAFVNLLLIGDQLSYKIFLTHIDLTPGDFPLSSLSALRSSAWAAVSGMSVVNLVAAAALGVWAWRGRAGVPAWLHTRRALWAAAWAVAACAVSLGVEAGHLQEHPVFSLLVSAAAEASPAVAAAPADGGAGAGPSVPLADLYLPRSPGAAPPPGEDARLGRLLARLRRLPRPNVLLVVLESVGSKQLFAWGRIAPRIVPHLAARLASGVAFSAVYAPFPGTTRSHIALETGGADLAGGEFEREVRTPFTGPTAARAFARMGYRTAVFSAGDLGPQDLGEVLSHLGYDLLFDPGRQPAAWRSRYEVSSWGVDEKAVCDRLLAWIGQEGGAAGSSGPGAGGAAGSGGRPWFAQLLTVSTHHPYTAPGVSTQVGDRRKYEAAVGYTDEVLEKLLDRLARDGQLARTLVLVTGDHGEAFATWHALNLVHRNYLYEENVRSFLLVLPPPGGAGEGGVVTERVGTMGDVVPTLLDALGQPAAGMPGRSLWPDSYSPRIVFFSKNTQPAQWGLRDGRYKFIARVGRDQRLELYDLDQDPDEQDNLAAARLDRALLYDRLCARWFASATADYKARLAQVAQIAPGKDRPR